MKLKVNILLCIIILFGFTLRIYNINWDQNFHLQPDERFLTMLNNAMKLPQTFSQYLDPATSTFNPANIHFTFFVYGIFPLTIGKILTLLFHTDNYNDFTILGRFLSALADTGVIYFVYKIAESTWGMAREEKLRFIPLLAAFLYAISVLPIQLSHFFATDTFLNFFTIASFAYALSFSYQRKKKDIAISALCLGCAIACKITAIFILPLNAVFLAAGFLPKHHVFSLKNLFHIRFFPVFGTLLMYMAITYATVRIADPYLFQSQNLLNPTINNNFHQSLQMLESENTPTTTFPPSVQWLHKTPVLFSLKNLMFFGLGLPQFLLVIIGCYFVLKKSLRSDLLIIFLWVLCFFLYQSTQFSKVIRYFLIIYPFLAMISAIGFYYLLKNIPRVFTWVSFLILFIWPLSFISIYGHTNTRVAASEWIYENIPDRSIILGELWDDPLPLQVPQTYNKHFDGQLMPVFDPDSSEKWQKMNDLLTKGDYLILSSNRAWGSIPTVPERYPQTIQYYKDLFAGKLAYKKIKEFTSYPSLSYLEIPITFPDNWAEEQFTVFDHPQVMIFQKM